MERAARVLDAGKELVVVTARMFPDGAPNDLGEAKSECEEALTTIACAEKQHTGHLFAEDMGGRLLGPIRIKRALLDFRLPTNHEHQNALHHVMTREPKKRSAEPWWRRHASTRNEDAFGRLMNKTVRGRVLDRYRTLRRLSPAESQELGRSAATEELPEEFSTETAWESRQSGTDRLERSEAAIKAEIEITALLEAAALTSRETEVLSAVAVDGEKVAEAARRLGIAASTARNLLMRARRKVRAAQSRALAEDV